MQRIPADQVHPGMRFSPQQNQCASTASRIVKRRGTSEDTSDIEYTMIELEEGGFWCFVPGELVWVVDT